MDIIIGKSSWNFCLDAAIHQNQSWRKVHFIYLCKFVFLLQYLSVNVAELQYILFFIQGNHQVPVHIVGWPSILDYGQPSVDGNVHVGCIFHYHVLFLHQRQNKDPSGQTWAWLFFSELLIMQLLFLVKGLEQCVTVYLVQPYFFILSNQNGDLVEHMSLYLPVWFFGLFQNKYGEAVAPVIFLIFSLLSGVSTNKSNILLQIFSWNIWNTTGTLYAGYQTNVVAVPSGSV